jgi:hypothetical protein
MRFALLLVAVLVAPSTRAAAAVFPLKTAETGRYLVDQKGEPFLVVGDTSWSLIVQPTEADIDRYLDDRARRGFNSVLVSLIEHKFCSDSPKTRAGLAPFTKKGDFSTLNRDYFDFAYTVVKKANDRGIVVWLFPAYLGVGGGDEGWFREMKAAGRPALRAYGRFAGRRFKDLPNIVWVLGGDYAPAREDQWTLSDVAEGILEEDREHPMTAHASRDLSAVDAFGDPKWLTIDSTYLSDKTLFRPMLKAYDRSPTRPFVLIEYFYEGENSTRPADLRRQANWAMLSGACGQFFGNNPIWHFDGPGLYPSKVTWQEALDSTGSQDMARLGRLFSALTWWQLVPEKDHCFVTDGYGSGVGTALSAQTPDKRLSVTYVPSTGTGPRALTLHMGQVSGPITARWYNPTDGQSTSISDLRQPLSNTHVLRTPGDNGTGTNDWLLVIQRRGRRNPISSPRTRPRRSMGGTDLCWNV